MCHTLDKTFEKLDSRKEIPFSDKKSKATYKVLNPDLRAFSTFEVEKGLLINSSEKKCEHLLIDCHEDKLNAYFIEIKGSDLTHAAKQILKSITDLEKHLKGLKINARIAINRVNTTELNSQEYISFKQKIKSKGGNVIQKVALLTEIL